MSDRGSGMLRRVADVGVSVTVLIVTAPLLLLISLTVVLSSGLPVFYFQTRVGRDGRQFDIWKFRTMKTDAEPSGPMLSHPDDPRVTVIGRLLRRSHFDELPQFWNVLRGDMTLVSYRPERQFFVERICVRLPEFGNLLVFKPGLISKGVIDYGYASTVDTMIERARLDLDYLATRNALTDFQLIAKAFGQVLGFKGT